MYYIFSLSICGLLLLLPFFFLYLLIFQKLYIFVLMIILVILNFLSTFFPLLLSIGSLIYTWLKLASKFVSHSISLASKLKNFPFIPNFTYKFIKWTYFTYTNNSLVISQIFIIYLPTLSDYTAIMYYKMPPLWILCDLNASEIYLY